MNTENDNKIPAEVIELLRKEILETFSPWKTVKQAADYLRTSESTIKKLTRVGRLRVKYFANSPRFHREDLDKALTDEKHPFCEEARENSRDKARDKARQIELLTKDNYESNSNATAAA